MSERTVVCVIKPGSRKGPAVEVADDGDGFLLDIEAIDGCRTTCKEALHVDAKNLARFK